MRVVVTGADGFVGRVLVKRLLLEPDVEVLAVSRRPQIAARRITPVLADLSQPGWSSELPKKADIVFALAQSQRYSEFPEGAIDMMRVNIASATELLDWARSSGVNRFVLASTGNVYKPSSFPLNERDLCEPTSFYGATKLSAEYLTRAYGSHFKIVIARLFGVYGVDQRRGLFRNLLSAVVEERKVTLGKGSGLRLSPIFVDDCAEALVRLSLVDFPASEQVVNVSSDEITDIRNIVVMMGQLLAKPPVFVETDDQPASLVADIGGLTKLLEWKPATSLHDGLKLMLRPLLQ